MSEIGIEYFQSTSLTGFGGDVYKRYVRGKLTGSSVVVLQH